MSAQNHLFLRFLKALREGVSDNSNDFHNFVFSNSVGRTVASRHVVIRDFIEKNHSIIFFSDLRSPKVHSILENKSTACVFYSKRAEFQIRASTISQILKDKALVDSYWESVPNPARKSYLTVKSPSSKSNERTDGLPKNFNSFEKATCSKGKARQNFCVIENVITELDLLTLSPRGHSRAKFTFEKNSVQMNWLVP